MSNEDKILVRWREHFKALLNPDSVINSTVDVQIVEESSIFEAEVARAIKALKSGKTGGVDEIRPVMLKSMGEASIPWLARKS